MIRPRINKNHPFFKYTLVWYLAFAVIYFIFCAIVFLYVVSMVRGTIITNNISALKQNSKSVDLVKASIENFADSVTYNTVSIETLPY